MGTEATLVPDARYYKTRALFVAAGSVIALAANAIHPDLPVAVREAHALIAARADWRVTHLAIIVAALLLSFGLSGLAVAARSRSGVERLALISTIVGASVVAVSIGIDGFAEKVLSDAWANGPAAQRAQDLVAATPIQLIHVGLFYIWAGIFWGVSFVLYGWAILESRTFPLWFGWAAAISGFLVCIVTAAQYVSPRDSVEITLRILLFVEILWTLVLGRFMWRLELRRSAPLRSANKIVQ